MHTNEKVIIYRDVFGGWRWECIGPDGEARDSQFSYDTRIECVADATRRGLLARPRRVTERAKPVARAPQHPAIGRGYVEPAVSQGRELVAQP